LEEQKEAVTSTRRTARARAGKRRASTPRLPEAEVRRFDVFAEWNRLKALEELKLPPADAKAYGLAVAKVVAGRRGRPGEARRSSRASDRTEGGAGHPRREDWWRGFGSAREFDGDIVGRMGKEFYRTAFQPALSRAWKSGMDYVGIRDSIREEWNRRRAERR
jgi:hypothetical protein